MKTTAADIPTVVLAVCLVVCVAATVLIVVLKGQNALVGTGLGVLTASIASGLVWRVKEKNGGG